MRITAHLRKNIETLCGGGTLLKKVASPTPPPPKIFMAEQFHIEIALATARAGARREGVSAVYLRG